MADTSFLQSLQAAGIDPNNHHSMSGSIIWTNAALLFVVTIIVFARLMVRAYIQPVRRTSRYLRAFGFDDLFIVLAWFFTTLFAVFSIHGATLGLGRHITDILTEHPDPALEYTQQLIIDLFVGYCSYTFSNLWTKLSIIAAYFRIFPNMLFRHFMWFLAIFVILQGIASVTTIIFECTPVASSWNWNLKRESCIDIQVFFYVTAAINTATDFTIWAAPIYLFWKTQMSRKQRIALVLLYSIGLVSCIAGLFRIGQLNGLSSLDITYNGALPLNCSMLEVSLGIICACIPPLRPGFRYVMLKFGWIKPPVVDRSKDTPVSSPYLIDSPYFSKRNALSRINAIGSVNMQDDIEFDVFEENYSKYTGSSFISLNAPSVGSPSAVSEHPFV